MADVSTALAIGADEEETPWVESERDVIEHFNAGRMKDFDDAHYFFFQGVKVYEKGKREHARQLDAMSAEQRQQYNWNKPK